MTKKYINIICVLVMVVLLLSACNTRLIRGSGDLITEVRDVSDFNRVQLDGSGDLIIIQSDGASLSVETDDNLMQYVETDVRGDTLYLGFDNRDFTAVSPTRLRYTLHVIDLEGMVVDGSGDIESESLETNHLEILIDGSGDIKIDSLFAEEVDITLDGSGRLELAGEVTRQDILSDSSGDYLGGDLHSESADVVLDGSGEVTVWVTESLDVNLDGSGSVNYYGNPTVNSSDSGSGDLNHLGDK
jgi:predicted small secreted protein